MAVPILSAAQLLDAIECVYNRDGKTASDSIYRSHEELRAVLGALVDGVERNNVAAPLRRARAALEERA